MKRSKGFKEGDNVFAKIKGYPAWPAVIVSKSGKKFNVRFYGTGETGTIKAEDIFYYLKNREQFVKGSKKKEFKGAIDEIEKAIAVSGTDGDNNQGEDDEGPSAKRKRSNSEKSSESAASSSRKRYGESDEESEVSETSASNTVESSRSRQSGTRTESIASNADDVVDVNISQEDLPFKPSLKLVSEANLKSWILYADYVKDSPELYKVMSVEPRNHLQDQTFPVALSSGGDKCVGLKIHKEWPLPDFPNEYEAAMYDQQVASRLLLIKDAAANGEITHETDADSFVGSFNMSELEVKRDIEMKIMNVKCKRALRLRTEATLVELDSKIKNNLGLSKADAKKAAGFLDDLVKMEMDEIMLKKHSHVVEMIRRLRKYIGNIEEWNMTQEELQVFLADAQQVRTKADAVYKKFKEIVTLPEGTNNFWDGFNAIVQKFREDCKFLNNKQVFILSAEPYTRAAIIDKLEQEEELQEADINKSATVEITKKDKENVSQAANAEE